MIKTSGLVGAPSKNNPPLIFTGAAMRAALQLSSRDLSAAILERSIPAPDTVWQKAPAWSGQAFIVALTACRPEERSPGDGLVWALQALFRAEQAMGLHDDGGTE